MNATKVSQRLTFFIRRVIAKAQAPVIATARSFDCTHRNCRPPYKLVSATIAARTKFEACFYVIVNLRTACATAFPSIVPTDAIVS